MNYWVKQSSQTEIVPHLDFTLLLAVSLGALFFGSATFLGSLTFLGSTAFFYYVIALGIFLTCLVTIFTAGTSSFLLAYEDLTTSC